MCVCVFKYFKCCVLVNIWCTAAQPAQFIQSTHSIVVESTAATPVTGKITQITQLRAASTYLAVPGWHQHGDSEILLSFRVLV